MERDHSGQYRDCCGVDEMLGHHASPGCPAYLKWLSFSDNLHTVDISGGSDLGDHGKMVRIYRRNQPVDSTGSREMEGVG
jgi:hypothetical protein